MDSRISSYFFFVLLLGAVVISAVIFLPFLTPLMLAAVAAVVTYPLFRRLVIIFGGSEFARIISALITVVIVLAIILVPLFFLVGSIYAEIQTLYNMLIDEANRSELISTLNNMSQWLSDAVFGVLPAHSFDGLNVTTFLKSILETLFSNLDNVFSSIAKVAGYALVFLLGTYYFLKDGHTLKRRFISWSPMLDRNDIYITHMFKKAVRSVFAGSMVASILQGISTGLAFWVFGIPAPALWGTCAAIAALVPGFGVSLLILPGTAYLILTHNYYFAAGLFAWGYAAIIFIDHMLAPALMNRGIHIHPFLVLLSVLGGLLMFGFIGFFMGPLILVMLFTLLEIYKTSFVKTE